MIQRSSRIVRTHRGFTLIELLIGMGILGILSSVALVAINPKENIRDARDAMRKSSVRVYEQAITQYLISKQKLPGNMPIPKLAINAMQICGPQEQSKSCIRLLGIVPDFLAELPKDIVSTTSTGYCVYLDDKGHPHVFAMYMGKLKGDDIVGINCANPSQ